MRKFLGTLALLCCGSAGCAVTDWAPYEEFVPPGGQGPVVMLISGSSGPHNYVFLANDLASRGYYVVLSDGHAFPVDDATGRENLQRMITEAQRSPHAVPGKVGVVGLSLGGGDVLAYASTLPDLVSVAVAYYPATKSLPNKDDLIRHWTVPTLVFAGDRDDDPQQGGCCMIDTIQAMAAAAKDRGDPFDLVVYPGVHHGFNLPISFKFDRYATEDAWQRTLATLHRHLGSPS
jgi:dienelactone hydrolase